MTDSYQTLERARDAGQHNPTMVAFGIMAVVHLESGLYHFLSPGIMALESTRDAQIVEMWKLSETMIWESIFPVIEVAPFVETKEKPYDIIGTRWHTNHEYLGIGVIAIRTHNPTKPLEWKAYIGLSTFRGKDADEDGQRIVRNQQIAAWGSPLLPREAHGYFPHLKLEDYKHDG